MSPIEINQAKSNGWYLEYIDGNGVDGEVWMHPKCDLAFSDNVPLEVLLNHYDNHKNH